MAPAVNGLRVVIVSHYFPPHLGGIEFVALHQARRLAAGGASVTVVSSRVPRSAPASEVIDGVRVRRVAAWNGAERAGVPFPLFMPALLVVLLRTIRRADVVHVHDGLYLSSWLAAAVARLLGRPLVVTQHVALVPHPSALARAVQRWVYATAGAFVFAAAARVLVLNESVKEFLIRRGVAASRIVPTVNAVDCELFRPGLPGEREDLRRHFGLPPGPVVLFVGRLVPKKGYRHVLDACAAEEFHVVFAGGSPDDAGFARPGVTVLGQLPQEELARLYRAADVFVLPSTGEGFPLSVQEAMASGLPVVTMDDPGYREYRLDPQGVRLLKRVDGEVLRGEVRALLADDARRARMARYGRRYAEEHFSWHVVTAQLAGCYDLARRAGVVQVAPYYPPHLGGMERVAEAISDELARRGADVRVVTSAVDDPGPEGGRDVGRDVGPRVVRLRAFEFAHTPVAPGLVAALLRVRRPAVVHLHLAQAFFPEVTMLLCRLRGLRYVLHFHLDLMPSGRLGRLFLVYKATVLRAVIRGADRVIVFSAEQQDFVRTTYRLPRSRVVVVPNGVGVEYAGAERPGPAGRPARLLYVGRLSAQKRVDRLIDALALVAAPVQLVVVGDGELRADLEAQARRLGLANVRFEGQQPREEVLAQLAAADLFVIGSEREGMPLVVLEAMAAGLPVVGTDVTGIRELVRGVGRLVDGPPVQGLAAAVDAVLADPGELAAMSRRSLEQARRYTWAGTVDALEGVYRDVVA